MSLLAPIVERTARPQTVIDGNSINDPDRETVFAGDDGPSQIIAPTHRTFWAEWKDESYEITTEGYHGATLDKLCLASSCKQPATDDWMIRVTPPRPCRLGQRK